MPKIIFRPNPVPPPFPPPGPIYPSNSLKITPYPFEPITDCKCDIINLQEITDHKEVSLFLHLLEQEGKSSVQTLSSGGSPIETSFEAVMDYNSTEIDLFFIEVIKNDDSTYTIPLTLV